MPFTTKNYAVASLRNLDSGEILFFQFHPESLTERIDVAWARQLPVGGSHEIAVYNGTRSERIPLRLFYTTVGGFRNLGGASFTSGGSGLREVGPSTRSGITPTNRGTETRRFGTPVSQNETIQKLDAVERFLKSLCYGDQLLQRRHGRKVKRATAPPLVLFDWPEIIKIEAHVESLAVRYDRFDAGDLSPLILVADLALVEAAPVNGRILGHKVRRDGTQRGDSPVIRQWFRTPKGKTITVRSSFKRPSGGRGPNPR